MCTGNWLLENGAGKDSLMSWPCGPVYMAFLPTKSEPKVSPTTFFPLPQILRDFKSSRCYCKFCICFSVPSVAPVTTQGCFDVVSSGNDTDVFIYWARIPEKYENGGNFTYNVICTKNNMKDW